MNIEEFTYQIKTQAYQLGFDACSICPADPVDKKNSKAIKDWLANNYQAEMSYLENNLDKRLNPSLLVENGKTIVMLAINYYPHRFQDAENPQFAYYAYGKDYHDIVKNKLKSLYEFTRSLDSNVEGRYFCDTAPLLERYWAARSGIGWIGKNSLLIIPKKGSYFFLAALILNIELVYDDLSKLKMPDCANCTRCIDACPTQAIVEPRVINSNKCLSYQTIENKGEIPSSIIPRMHNRVYGCDICQQVCPWNRFATPHSTDEFNPSEEFLALTADEIKTMKIEDYQRIFKGSAIKRAKLSGLKRNINALKSSIK